MDSFTLHLVFGPLLGHRSSYKWEFEEEIYGTLESYTFKQEGSEMAEGYIQFKIRDHAGRGRRLDVLPADFVGLTNDGQQLIIYYRHCCMSISLSP